MADALQTDNPKLQAVLDEHLRKVERDFKRAWRKLENEILYGKKKAR